MTVQPLPIDELRDEVARHMKEGNRLILQAPTGSGKSTRLPQFLLDDGLSPEGQILVLQPRRLPARMLAARVASERGSKPGKEVGYQIRFDDVSCAQTRIKFITEGLLQRIITSNPSLKGIGAILFDEFHERHLHGDVALAQACHIQKTLRPGLRIVVASATLETTTLSEALAPCPIIQSEGRTFPVDIRYLKKLPSPQTPIWETAAQAVLELMSEHPGGDALVFMPGAYEINRTIETLRRTARSSLTLLPLHGELSASAQDEVMQSSSNRKVIVSTNVAETSLTIEGVRLVIDSGLARIPRFDPNRGIDTLLIEKISLASADQRAGRAGRTAPGTCLRLWPERENTHRPRYTQPETERLDLAETLLFLKGQGFSRSSDFPWIDAPPAPSVRRAGELLQELGAASSTDGSITERGRQMQAFPAHPRYARMLLEAAQRQCVAEACLLAALTQERSVLTRPGSPKAAAFQKELLADSTASDFIAQFRAVEIATDERFDVRECEAVGIRAQSARRASLGAHQLMRIAERQGLPTESPPAPWPEVARCLLAGFPDRVALRPSMGSARCILHHGQAGSLSKDCAVQAARLMVICEVRELSRKGGKVEVVFSLASAIEEAWLGEVFPDAFHETEEVRFDETTRRVVGIREKRFGSLVLESSASGEPSPEEASHMLARRVLDGSLKLKNWTDEIEQWIVRVNGLSAWCPELEIPPLRDEDRPFLIQQVCDGAFGYKEIKDREVWPVIRSWLSPAQADALAKLAPERIELPSGRRAKIRYQPDGPPILSAKIQDLYDAPKNLQIALGKTPLLYEILAPNFRPVQLTDDLAGFWERTYPEIKPQLKRRYPRHEWR